MLAPVFRGSLGLLRFAKWQLIIPLAQRFNLSTGALERFTSLTLVGRADVEVTPGGVTFDEPTAHLPEQPFKGPHEFSRITAEIRSRLGEEAAEQWRGSFLASDATRRLAEWSKFYELLSENADQAFAFGESLLGEERELRYLRALLHAYNRVGNIRRAEELAREVAAQTGDTKTHEIIAARRRLLDAGFSYPKSASAPYSPSPKRALYLLHNSLPYASGGYATRTHGLLCGMKGSGWDTEAVTRLGFPSDIGAASPLSVPGRHVIDGITYWRLRDRDGQYRKAHSERYIELNIQRVSKLAAKRRPAVIHGASNHINGLTAVAVGKSYGIPSVYEVRGLWELTRASREPAFFGTEYYEQIARLETQACLDADAVITITRALKDFLVERGVSREKITVVPNGVDTRRFRPSPKDPQLIQYFGVERKTVFGYIGSMPQYEGLDDLLHAVATFSESQRKDMYFLLVGDGDSLPSLVTLRNELGLRDCVRFTGRIPHAFVERLYSVVDVAVFPRKPQMVCEMVSPMKPFEAMAMAKPVLASDVGALAEIVVDGETGRLYRKGQRHMLAEALDSLVSDPDKSADLGRRAREWVCRNRDWCELAREVTAVYRSLAE